MRLALPLSSLMKVISPIVHYRYILITLFTNISIYIGVIKSGATNCAYFPTKLIFKLQKMLPAPNIPYTDPQCMQCSQKKKEIRLFPANIKKQSCFLLTKHERDYHHALRRLNSVSFFKNILIERFEISDIFLFLSYHSYFQPCNISQEIKTSTPEGNYTNSIFQRYIIVFAA